MERKAYLACERVQFREYRKQTTRGASFKIGFEESINPKSSTNRGEYAFD